jgi:sugar phosphate isomerase/epimerase
MNNNPYQLGMRAVHQKNLKTAILEAKKNGFEFLEIHFSSPQFLPQNYTGEQAREIKLFAEKQGIVLSTHSEIGQSLILTDSFSREAEKKKLKRMVDFSRKIGAVNLTLHPGKASAYYSGPGKSTSNEELYTKYYMEIFEDSIKHLVSIASKDLCICIENTDNFSLGYQKILSKYLKTGKLFLTWDIMKSFSSHKPEMKLYEDRVSFLKRNIKYVKNLHISGPSHGGLHSHEKDFTVFFDLFKNKNIPMIIEIINLPEVIQAKNIIRGLGF